LPKVSGFNQAKDRIVSYIVNTEAKEVDRASVASLLECSISTAGNYLSVLSKIYPDNFIYARGVLRVMASIPVKDLPLSTRMEAKEMTIKGIKEMARKIEKNHLSHIESSSLKEAIKNLLKELERL
jgi:hypothetical protein